MHLLHRRLLGRGICGVRARAATCCLYVGRVLAVGAPHEVVLADRGNRHELAALRTSHLARLRLDRAKRERAPLEHAVVRVVHAPIARAKRVEIDVERVRILHQELSPAQQAEAWPQLVAVLPVDLIEVQRQVAVRAVLLGDEARDQLLGRRREAVAGLLAVEETEHQRAVRLVAAAALPELERLRDRQQDLLGAGRVHLLPDDLLGLPQYPVAEREPRVDPGAGPADEAGPDEQAVAFDLGVGGVVAQGAQE